MGKRGSVPEGKQRIRVETGIYLKASGRYLAYYRDPGRKSHWAQFRTRNEAREWRARALLDPASVRSGKRTLAEVWATFVEHHGANLRPTTRANWEQEWKAHIAPGFGTWPIGRIGVIEVKKWLAEMEIAGVGAATRHKCRSILGRLLGEAVENGEIASNPVAARGTRVKLPQRRKARILDPGEVRQVIIATKAISGESDALAVELMFFLGLRIGEMAGLQAGDVDLKSGEIVIRRTVVQPRGGASLQNATKTAEYRVIPVPKELPLWTKLDGYVRRHGFVAQAQLFTAPEGGLIHPNNWRRRVWRPAMQKAGILDPPTSHAGRRTTASLLQVVGVPAGTIQAILGHSTLQQTGEYIDVPREAMEAGLRKLGKLMGLAR